MAGMEQIVVITAVGQDRPGIIAALTEAVYALGGNLDDATMTRLHGAFAAMLSVKLPANVTTEDARMALIPLGDRLDLTVSVQSVEESAPETPSDCLLAVYGADKPGIVYQITQRLAQKQINITDMDTRVAGTPDAPLYVMLLEVHAGEVDLAEDLAALRAELGVDIKVQALDSEAL